MAAGRCCERFKQREIVEFVHFNESAVSRDHRDVPKISTDVLSSEQLSLVHVFGSAVEELVFVARLF